MRILFMRILFIITIQVLLFSSVWAQKQNEKVISRSAFLSLDERAQIALLGSEKLFFSDLITVSWEQKVQDPAGRFFIHAQQFQDLPLEKQAHIIRNPDTYIIVPGHNNVPQMRISKSELEALPAEKQNNIRTSGRFIIIED